MPWSFGAIQLPLLELEERFPPDTFPFSLLCPKEAGRLMIHQLVICLEDFRWVMVMARGVNTACKLDVLFCHHRVCRVDLVCMTEFLSVR